MSKEKVYVGLSGGVDSSVSAALLKEKGYSVTGVFIKIWHPDFLQCDWRKEMRDAMRVCARLNIPFKKLDLSLEYKNHVIDYMISEYKEGRTPNPDVMCNKYIKFGKFFNFASKEGADWVATGHYAQTNNGRLIKAHDEEKDQTYFLWTLKKKQLEKVLFPIGDLKKEAVRKFAEKYNLFTATKKDSQGLCFIGDVNMKEFLKKHIKTQKGNVLNENSDIIGEHDGSILYTIGERHGFRIFHKGEKHNPLYVISKNLDKNTITVSDKRIEKSPTEITLKDISFVDKKCEGEIESRVRYRQSLQASKLISNKITFQTPQNVANGQSVVFYKQNECVGGGIICL